MAKGDQGISSRHFVEPRVKTGSGSKGVSPGWAGQKGQMQGNHITNKDSTGYRGEPKFTGQNFQPTKFGNEVALNVGKGGPGTGRDVHPCGSQGMQGRPEASGNPSPSRDILESFGPDYKR
jgi:hypothetical protein